MLSVYIHLEQKDSFLALFIYYQFTIYKIPLFFKISKCGFGDNIELNLHKDEMSGHLPFCVRSQGKI